MQNSSSFWRDLVTVVMSSWVAASAAESAPPPIPTVATRGHELAFPPYERRQNHEGSVLVEFSINEKGRVRHVEAVETSSAEFSKGAKRLLNGIRFKVTQEWIDAGGIAARYRYGFVFDLQPCARFANPWGGDLDVIKICASALPGSPPPKVLDRH